MPVSLSLSRLISFGGVSHGSQAKAEAQPLDNGRTDAAGKPCQRRHRRVVEAAAETFNAIHSQHSIAKRNINRAPLVLPDVQPGSVCTPEAIDGLVPRVKRTLDENQRVNRELRLRNLGIETEEQRIADLDKQINTLYQDNSRLRKSKPQRSNMGADQRKHKEGST